MEFRTLGPAEMRCGDMVTPFPAGIPGAILAILLIHQGTTVSVDRLIGMIWGDRPVKSATRNVRSHVGAARDSLPVGDPTQIMETREGGYQVPRRAGTCDVTEFESLAKSSSRALRSGDPADAAEITERALALWEGRPFEGVKLLKPIRAERKRLERVWLSVQETSFDAAVRLKRHREVLPEMERLASAHPSREHLHALLMRALDQDGQQKEALAVFDRIYRVLDEDLGQPPGEELQKMQHQILTRGSSIARVPGQRAGRHSPQVP